MLNLDEYGHNYIRDTFGPFNNLHITAMGQSETVRYFGSREMALQNILLSKERYKSCLRHGTVQVLNVDEYGPNYIRDTFRPFYNVYTIYNGLIANCEYARNMWKGVLRNKLPEEQYKNCLRHDTGQVTYFEDDGSNYIRDMFSQLYNVNITRNGSIARKECFQRRDINEVSCLDQLV